MTLLWVSISIILALNSIWLLKLNKDLVDRNKRLIRESLVKEISVIKLDQDRTITEEEVEKLNRVLEDKED